MRSREHNGDTPVWEEDENWGEEAEISKWKRCHSVFTLVYHNGKPLTEESVSFYVNSR